MDKELGLPVLCCDTEGSEEDLHIKPLGYHQGKIEDVLRLVAVRATHAPARFGADYEISVRCYDSPEDVHALFMSIQQRFGSKEQHPDIILTHEQEPINASVAVHVRPEENIQQFIDRLLPETHHKIVNYTDGTPACVVIDL